MLDSLDSAAIAYIDQALDVSSFKGKTIYVTCVNKNIHTASCHEVRRSEQSPPTTHTLATLQEQIKDYSTMPDKEAQETSQQNEEEEEPDEWYECSLKCRLHRRWLMFK